MTSSSQPYFHRHPPFTEGDICAAFPGMDERGHDNLNHYNYKDYYHKCMYWKVTQVGLTPNIGGSSKSILDATTIWNAV